MKLPRRRFLHLAAGAAALPTVLRVATAQAYLAVITQRRVLDLNERALESLRSSLGSGHPYALCCATNLASDLAATGDHGRALALSKETLDLSLSGERGPNHPYTLACANNYALDLAATGAISESAELRQRTLTELRRNPNIGEAHPDMVLAKDGRRIDCDVEPPPF